MNDYYILGSVAAIFVIAIVLFVVLRRRTGQSIGEQKSFEKRTDERSIAAEAREAQEVDQESARLEAKTEKQIIPQADSFEEKVLEPVAISEPEPESEPESKLEAEFAPTSEKESPTEKPELKSLDQAMEQTRKGFLGRIKGLFSGGQSLTPDEFEELEEILYTSDLGPQTVQRLMDGIDERLSRGEKSDFESVRSALRSEMNEIFEPVNDGDALTRWQEKQGSPLVLMIVGVNGAGKTTTIGKLASRLSDQGKKVMVAAGDTFRAAAEDQLKVWSERAQVEIFSPPGVKDPSAVAYDACKSAQAQGVEVLIIDTAGRLHTQSNLMEELKKMKRVVDKAFPGAPDEVLLVLDANSGQNALIQAKKFHEALNVTGVVLTKLDGTAKGGVAVGVACELQLPICLIGVGESLADLRPFSAQEFVDSIL